MSKPDLCMVEKQVSVKVGQLWSHVEGKRAQDPGCSDAEVPGWTLTGQTPLSCFCACARVCLGSLPGHVKTSWRKTGWALSSPHLQSPQGREDPQGRLSDELWTGKPLPRLSASGSTRADAQANQSWCGKEAGAQWRRREVRHLPLHQAPSWPQNVEYCFARSTHSLCGCRFTFR